MNLSSILEGDRKTLSFEKSFDPIELDNEHGIRYLSPLNIKGIIRNTGALLQLEGDIQSNISVDCARCLAEVKIPVALEVKAVLMTEDRRSWDDEYDSFILDGQELDLIELANSEILQFIPIQPLCDTDCKGICSGCGANLNEEQCSCEEQTDSRFDILKQLIK